MSSDVGTRRSILHDVLSQSEVIELGLDGSVDDLPPLSTRLLPACGRALNAFCWCYFACFWLSATVVLRHVAVSHPDTLLPGLADLIFISVCSALLVGVEFGMYWYVKGENALPDGGTPGGAHFTPSSSCVVAHFALSATTRMCTFLELLFLLHAFVLPTPMTGCASFTVSLTSGLVPFLLQLRSLIGFYCSEAFDPLQCSTCIPLGSVVACFSRLRRTGVALLGKAMHFALGGARATGCWAARVARLCSVRIVRRTSSTSPGRRMDSSCRLPGSDGSTCQGRLECETGAGTFDSDAGNEGGQRGVARERAAINAHKEPLIRSAGRHVGTVDPACAEARREGPPAAMAGCRAQTSEALTRVGWTEQLQEGSVAETLRDATSSHGKGSGTCDGSPPSTSITPSDTQEAPSDTGTANRNIQAFISPRRALELTNCLLFLDLPTLGLHVKANFLPLEQLEAHEFLSSTVSLMRLYSGDCCMLLYLMFGLCTSGVNALFILLLVFLLLKLKSACFATVLAHIAAVFGLWDVE